LAGIEPVEELMSVLFVRRHGFILPILSVHDEFINLVRQCAFLNTTAGFNG